MAVAEGVSAKKEDPTSGAAPMDADAPAPAGPSRSAMSSLAAVLSLPAHVRVAPPARRCSGARRVEARAMTFNPPPELGRDLSKMATGAVDAVAGLVPESVPRPAARAGAGLALAATAWFVIKSFVSGVVTLAVARV